MSDIVGCVTQLHLRTSVVKTGKKVVSTRHLCIVKSNIERDCTWCKSFLECLSTAQQSVSLAATGSGQVSSVKSTARMIFPNSPTPVVGRSLWTTALVTTLTKISAAFSSVQEITPRIRRCRLQSCRAKRRTSTCLRRPCPCRCRSPLFPSVRVECRQPHAFGGGVDQREEFSFARAGRSRGSSPTPCEYACSSEDHGTSTGALSALCPGPATFAPGLNSKAPQSEMKHPVGGAFQKTNHFSSMTQARNVQCDDCGSIQHVKETTKKEQQGCENLVKAWKRALVTRMGSSRRLCALAPDETGEPAPEECRFFPGTHADLASFRSET